MYKFEYMPSQNNIQFDATKIRGYIIPRRPRMALTSWQMIHIFANIYYIYIYLVSLRIPFQQVEYVNKSKASAAIYMSTHNHEATFFNWAIHNAHYHKLYSTTQHNTEKLLTHILTY